MNIHFFEATPQDRAVFPTIISGVDIIFHDEKLSESTVSSAANADIISVFVNSEVRAPIIDALPSLKGIVTRSTGYDHVDCAYAKSKGIPVCNVPSYGSRTVAEFTFALMLNLTRHVFRARLQLLESENFDISTFRGFDLRGKTLGVVGTGRIGKNVIQIAKGFEMKILAYDAKPDDTFASQNGITYAPLTDVLAQSDIVTLHTPYITAESKWGTSTHHILNSTNIPLMKKGAILINTARGELVETEALVKALADGQLAGAGIDVMEQERPLKEGLSLFAGADASKITDYKTLFENQLLMNLPNVIVTPHIAFFSAEAEMEIIKTSADNIMGIMNGTPQNVLSV